MKIKYVISFIAILLIFHLSCTNNQSEQNLKKENDSLKLRIQNAESEINRLRDSVHIVQKGYSLKVDYNNPQDVAKAFIQALSNENFVAVQELGTKNSAKVFGIIESLANLADEDDDIDIDDIEDITWGETVIKGDYAVCYYTTSDNKNEQIDLKRVGDKWLVDIKKEN